MLVGNADLAPALCDDMLTFFVCCCAVERDVYMRVWFHKVDKACICMWRLKRNCLWKELVAVGKMVGVKHERE